MARRAARRLGAVLGIVVAVQALFLGGLLAAQSVPDDRVVERLAVAVNSGQYGPPYITDGIGGEQDKWTECAELGYGLGSTPYDRDFLERTVFAPRLQSCDQGRVQIHRLRNDQPVRAIFYARYWNGYSLLTRPVVAWLGVPGLRAVVTALLVSAGAFAMVVLGRRTGWPVAVALLVPLAATTNLLSTPGYAFTHALTWSVVLLGVGVTAVLAGRRGWRGGAVGAAAAGALFAYVDLLTTPAAAWALTAFAAAATVATRGAGAGQTARSVLAAGAAWPAAYAVTWASRWAITAAVLGSHTFDNVLHVARFRLSGTYGTEVRTAFGAATTANVDYWTRHIATAPVALAAAALVVVAGLVVAVRRHGVRSLGLVGLLWLPALTVPFWYEVMKNHSQIHRFFTYRSLPVGVGVLAAAVLVAAARPRLLVDVADDEEHRPEDRDHVGDDPTGEHLG